VMNLKNSIQSDIDYLNQYGISRRWFAKSPAIC
jgi:hypothetical protein